MLVLRHFVSFTENWKVDKNDIATISLLNALDPLQGCPFRQAFDTYPKTQFIRSTRPGKKTISVTNQ